MHTLTLAGSPPLAHADHTRAKPLAQAVLTLLCLCAGCAALAPRWLADDMFKVGLGLAIALAYLAFALAARASTTLRPYWPLCLAFFIFALVQVLNNSLPAFVGTAVLHDPPNSGNPFASTIAGTVIVQFIEMVIVVVPVVFLTRAAGFDLKVIYVGGRVSRTWLLLAAGFFVLFYVFLATTPLRPDSFAQRLLPTNGPLTITQFLAFSPALIVMSLSNGIEEELLLRGLFLRKFGMLFGPVVANVLQAAIFAFAHLGVAYTPSAVFFVAVIVFPVGIAAGYLMHKTNSLIVPTLFHGALDMAIYLSFLTYAS